MSLTEDNEQCSCDNCDAENRPFYLKYEFVDKSRPKKPYVKLVLCEDCSCMLSRLHFDCMESGESYEYDQDIGKVMLSK